MSVHYSLLMFIIELHFAKGFNYIAKNNSFHNFLIAHKLIKCYYIGRMKKHGYMQINWSGEVKYD